MNSSRLLSSKLLLRCARSRPALVASWPKNAAGVAVRSLSSISGHGLSSQSPATLPPAPESISQILDIPISSSSLSTTTTWDSYPSILATQVQDHAVAQDLAWYNASGYVMDLVHLTHDITGLSYATSIAAITIGIRVVFILPLGVASLRVDPNIERDVKDIDRKIKVTQNPTRYNELVAQHKELKNRQKRMMIRSTAMPIMSFGTFILMWFGLRYMGAYYPEDLASGGVLWFSDLTQKDDFFCLPTLSMLSFVLMGEQGADQLGRPTREFGPFWRNAWRGFRVLTFYFFMDAPAAIFCYWIPNSTGSIIQAAFLSHPAVREKIGIIPEKPKAKEGEPVIEFIDKDINEKEGLKQDSGKGKKMEKQQQLSIKKKRKTKRKR